MATAPRSAGIYARISSDVEGSRAGVDRQLADCHVLARALGWQVAQEYVDNDLSAYTDKKPRPNYQRLLADIEDGSIDGLLVYKMDRLTRKPIELEEFHRLAERAGLRHVRFVIGDPNMGTDDGLLMARIQGAFAARESANISQRVKRKLDQVAAEGRPHGGAGRPFGYAENKVTVVPEEATVYRELVERYLAGESTKSLATWLNEAGVQSVKGAGWRTTTIRAILSNPRYAGYRVHRGEVVGTATWDPLIDDATHRRVLARMSEKKNLNRRTPQTYLLSGLLRCGKCEGRLYSSPRKNTRRYVCLSGPDHGGCGRLTVVADPLERFIADAVLYRLDTPEMADVLAGRNSEDERTAELSSAVEHAQRRLDDLALEHGNGGITMREWKIAKKPIEGQLNAARKQLSRMTRNDALAGLVGNGQQLSRSWSSLVLSQQHAIVSNVIEHGIVAPGTPGATEWDPSRLSIVWRV